MPPPSLDHSASTITGRAFAVRRKGFDPDEVRAYLGQLAEIVGRTIAERDAARKRAVDLEAEAAVRPAIDEDQLTAVLGEETARVLSSARKAGVEIKARAEENVARMLREAVEEAGATRRDAEADAARLREEAQQVLSAADEARRSSRTQAEAEANRLRTEAEAEADRLRTEAAADATAQRDGAQADRAAAAAERQATNEQAEADAVALREAAQAERDAARIDAEAVREQAEADARRTRGEADEVLGQRTTEADVAGDAVRAEAEAEAAAIRAAAEDDAATIRDAAMADRDVAQDEGREMVAEARRVRERMLADLARRRKAARVQLDQLQGARDRLLESYQGVQRTLDEATAGLGTALPEARHAAEAARLRAESEPEATVEQLESQIAATRAAGLPLVAPVGDDVSGEDADGDQDLPPEVSADADTDGLETAEPDAHLVAAAVIHEVEVEASGAGSSRAEPAVPSGEPDASEVDAVARPSVADLAGAPEAAAPVGPEEQGEPEEVDELFARLRASRQASVAEAREVLDVPELAVDTAGEAPHEPADAGDDEGTLADAGDESTVAEPDEEGTVADPDDLVSLLERRDGAIEPIENRIARRLKRALADEQGRVLDGVRRSRDTPSLSEVLPPDEQIAAFAAAVADDLLIAAEEGAAFEGAALPSRTSVDDVTEELARALAGVVRPRVERCFEGGEDADDTSDRLRATYREWKTDRLVDATRHLVLSAFGLGQAAVRPAGAPVRWVNDPSVPACPDCEDDALAGTVPSGEAFPTGHARPPAHPGCRCLVVGERVAAPA